MYEPFVNPYQGYMPRPNLPKFEVVRVNGKGGAEAFQMAPNSDMLLLDTTAPIVWLKTTDGAGYATCTPYTITPYEPEPQVNANDLLQRIERLEAMINDKPNNSTTKRKQAEPEQ